MFQNREKFLAPLFTLLPLLLLAGSIVRADDPIPTPAPGPVLEVKEIEPGGEVCGTASDEDPPIEITVERIGDPSEVPVDTESNEDGSEVEFTTSNTGGDDPGTIYRVTAVDKFGNKTVKTVTRKS